MDLAPHLYPKVCYPQRGFSCTKKPYSKVEAETVLNQRMASRRGRPERLSIYPCPHCPGQPWHLTHKRQR